MLGGNDEAYMDRLDAALDLAISAGLPYAHQKLAGYQGIGCHACGAELVSLTEGCGTGDDRKCQAMNYCCASWDVQTSVTSDSRCTKCGALVPIVAMLPTHSEGAPS
jgi:hypothetical protein